MSDKLIPAHPAAVMVIRDITPNVTILSTPFSRGGLFEIGGRCTIGAYRSVGASARFWQRDKEMTHG